MDRVRTLVSPKSAERSGLLLILQGGVSSRAIGGTQGCKLRGVITGGTSALVVISNVIIIGTVRRNSIATEGR